MKKICQADFSPDFQEIFRIFQIFSPDFQEIFRFFPQIFQISDFRFQIFSQIIFQIFSPDFSDFFPNYFSDFFPNYFSKKVFKKLPPTKMWVLVSHGDKIIGEPAKSESAIAKRLGVSRQFLNKQLKKGKNCFVFKGTAVLVLRQMEFSAAGQEFETQNQMEDALGLSRTAVARVFKTGTTGVVQTKEGKEVKISRIVGFTFVPACPKPLPAIRVRSEVGGLQEFSSIAAASRELKIDPKPIPSALRSGRDSFTRKSDGQKFTVEIPGEEIPPQKKHDQELSKLNQAWCQTFQEENFEKAEKIAEQMKKLEVPPRTQKFYRRPVKMETYLKETPVTEREEHVREDKEKMAAWAEKNVEPPEEEEEEEEESPFWSELWRLSRICQ